MSEFLKQKKQQKLAATISYGEIFIPDTQYDLTNDYRYGASVVHFMNTALATHYF